MIHSHIVAATFLAGLCGMSCFAAAQSSGMDLVSPQVAEQEQVAAATVVQPLASADAVRGCDEADIVLTRSTVAHQRAGDPVEQARAEFDGLRSGSSGGWLFVLETVDSIYIDPELMKQALRDGRWLSLCRRRLSTQATDSN